MWDNHYGRNIQFTALLCISSEIGNPPKHDLGQTIFFHVDIFLNIKTGLLKVAANDIKSYISNSPNKLCTVPKSRPRNLPIHNILEVC